VLIIGITCTILFASKGREGGTKAVELCKNDDKAMHDDGIIKNAVQYGQQLRPNPKMHTRNVELEFPRFDGSHALEWLFRANQFFEYYPTADPDQPSPYHKTH
jgi:hypothetical protein